MFPEQECPLTDSSVSPLLLFQVDTWSAMVLSRITLSSLTWKIQMCGGYASQHKTVLLIEEKLQDRYVWQIKQKPGFNTYFWRKGSLTPFWCLHLNIVLPELCRGIPHKFNHILSISLGIKNEKKISKSESLQLKHQTKCYAAIWKIVFLFCRYWLEKRVKKSLCLNSRPPSAQTMGSQ